jgi:hypothetical protein
VNQRRWVLGAPDPEMEMIEALLRKCGETVAYAASAPGVRVHPGDAYRAMQPSECARLDGAQLTVYRVECSWDALFDAPRVITRAIDHHRPGDPGHGRPSEEFLGASSIGQTVAELARLGLLPWQSHRRSTYSVHTGAIAYGTPGGWEVCTDGHRQCEGAHSYWTAIPLDVVMMAAADHCLGAAYRGECPGVDPDALMRWRVASRAKHQGRSEAEILADIERARAALAAAPLLTLEDNDDHSGQSDYAHQWTCPTCYGGLGTRVKDMRATHVPELPEAGTRDGVPYVAQGLTGPDGRTKIVCSGPPAVIQVFFEWAAREGLVGAYGDPARGFAGAYLT